MTNKQHTNLKKSIGTWEVMVAGVALVVAASTLVSDFAGYFTLGAAFAIALVFGFLINLLLGISVADLSVAYPRAGALYDYARQILGGKIGELWVFFWDFLFSGCSASRHLAKRPPREFRSNYHRERKK